MNLALVGYGKMGRLVEQLAPQFGCSVVRRLDSKNNAGGAGINGENFRGVDVAVEFSTPEAAAANVEKLAGLGVATVTGTTGWFEGLPRVRSLVEQNGAGLVWSANYSVGMNAFMEIVSAAARQFAREADYGAWAWEMHHAAKKDAPSGTLVKLVEGMKQSGYTRAVSVSSNRAGAVPGTHEIGFDSPADTITLRHTARNREGFARGALRAAQWIAGKKGFFEFREILRALP
ncbi:MAG TPA: dihydrodipicolinate reductase C-terminal domain-containing protein [Methylomirabilota bacterium]|nr:dihydrodipicolinate reductase C-terminal domain-containing protein [Methylomirabilota bacterium]